MSSDLSEAWVEEVPEPVQYHLRRRWLQGERTSL